MSVGASGSSSSSLSDCLKRFVVACYQIAILLTCVSIMSLCGLASFIAMAPHKWPFWKHIQVRNYYWHLRRLSFCIVRQVCLAGVRGQYPNESTLHCSICCDEPLLSELASLDACNHFFCFQCITQWTTQGKHSCPCCRTPFHLVISCVQSHALLIKPHRDPILVPAQHVAWFEPRAALAGMGLTLAPWLLPSCFFNFPTLSYRQCPVWATLVPPLIIMSVARHTIPTVILVTVLSLVRMAHVWRRLPLFVQLTMLAFFILACNRFIQLAQYVEARLSDCVVAKNAWLWPPPKNEAWWFWRRRQHIASPKTFRAHLIRKGQRVCLYTLGLGVALRGGVILGHVLVNSILRGKSRGAVPFN